MLQDKIMHICREMKQYAKLQSEFKVTRHLWKFAEKWCSAYKARMLGHFWEGLSNALEAYDLENLAGQKHTVTTWPCSPMKIWLPPRPWSPVQSNLQFLIPLSTVLQLLLLANLSLIFPLLWLVNLGLVLLCLLQALLSSDPQCLLLVDLGPDLQCLLQAPLRPCSPMPVAGPSRHVPVAGVRIPWQPLPTAKVQQKHWGSPVPSESSFSTLTKESSDAESVIHVKSKKDKG